MEIQAYNMLLWHIYHASTSSKRQQCLRHVPAYHYKFLWRVCPPGEPQRQTQRNELISKLLMFNSPRAPFVCVLTHYLHRFLQKGFSCLQQY
jgi:hypothetical protein